MPVKKKPSAAQLAARAKFVKMVRAKAAAKKKAAPKKIAAKKVAGLDKITKKGKKTTVHYSRVSGVKKYDYNQLENITLTRVNNDVNGNPRYVLHFLEVLNKEEQAFLPFSKKYEYALKKAKKIGGRKFHNKQYGGGIVFQSYNTDNLKENIIDLLETTPNIKY
jgi:hypothetical protein